MSRIWIPWILILVAVFVVLFELFYFYPQLPEKIATHFDMQGKPDGWMSKASLLGGIVFALIVSVFPFVITALLLKYMPANMINLPHKDYWLAPERMELTKRELTMDMAWIGAATMLFLAYILHKLISANLDANPQLSISYALIIYLVFDALICIRMVMYFSRPPKQVKN